MKKISLLLLGLLLLTMCLQPTGAVAGTGPRIVNPFQAYSYDTMFEDANALQHTYPDIIRLGSAGKSTEGRALLTLELGNGSRKIYVNGAIHACEYIGTSYLMYMAEEYASAYKTSGSYDGFDLKTLFNNVTICTIPMVNPDGVNLVQNGLDTVVDATAVHDIAANDPQFQRYSRWKANIRGVDLNRNFDNNWDVTRPVTAPAASMFKGDTPVSETETQAIVNYVNSNMFWAFVNFHSQGEGLYGWDDKNSGYYPQLDAMVSRITAVSGFSRLTDTTDTDYGTFAGYARETFLKPTLTIELCNYVGSDPYPNEDFMSVWTPAKDFCLIIADEVMKMAPQKYLVFQNGMLLQAFCDSGYANAYAAKLEGALVIYHDAGCDGLVTGTAADASVSIDGVPIPIEAYTIDGNNYFKLRDLALALKGSSKQFGVSYDTTTAVVSLTSGQQYSPVGGELTKTEGYKTATALPSSSAVYLDGKKLPLTVYTIGGRNYFKLRDIGKTLNFGVTWDAKANAVRIVTATGYVD